MKYVLIVLTVLISLNANSQRLNSKDPKEGEHLTDASLDKYAGTWRYKNGNENFSLSLKKTTKEVKGKEIFFQDILKGDLTYTTSGNVFSAEVSAISIDDNTLVLMFNDKEKSKRVDVSVTYVNSHLQWRITEPKEIHANYSKPKKGFSIPEKMVLNR